MDTISSMATQAAKVVWGDGGEYKEPVSGAAGDVSKGEPYDAGNLGASDQNKLEKKMSGDESTPARPNPESTLDKKQDITSSNSSGSGSGSESKSSGGDDEGGSDTKVKIMGAGPKPLATVAKEHGGDAGNKNETSKGGSDKPATGADGAGNSHDSSDKKESEGTGEQYVKTTGFAADGGDFDATKPGAGREADRLLEQKGAHHEGGSDKDAHKDTHKDNSSFSSGSKDSKDKPSLGERIKNKLHRH
ncbi:hypothetical protein TOPH_02539 [Tolypocladium ophioglossoides CBS 100239]|uniref:Glycine-rich cell wall structural protein 1 n=1 Tax=Tolypocladium ophioglossoides (strain CBS 100239) TaxID=1163406 RepID=A0A0L0NFH6_TOLOC|nr:hypothetical protein TOPH_02539 [Tolypocladium ophioglossoides CBS 100239]